MPTPSSILSLFSEEEKLLLLKLEKQRIALRRKPFWWAFVIGAGVLLIAGSILIREFKKYENSEWPFLVLLASAFLFFAGVAWIIFNFPDPKDVSWKYKKMMLRRLVPKFLPGWVSATSHRLMNEDIKKSGLFSNKANRIAREDYLFGQSGKVVAEVYQIGLEAPETKRWKGKKSEGGANHFYGFFYRVHCPVIFPCDTWIFPLQRKFDLGVDNWAGVSEERYAHNFSRKKIITGDLEFDGLFSVYATNPESVFVILTASRRQNLIQVNRLFSAACAFSYTENKVYAMIGFSEDPLDINIKKEIGETLLHCHAEELERMRGVAALISAL